MSDSLCLCEHYTHDDGTDHPYHCALASKYEAREVGPVCAHCARTHMAEYLKPYPREGKR